jgi:DNA-binding NarL/FixJ family response regulator
VSTRKIRILVYSNQALFHAIRHVFQGRDEFEVLGQSGSVRGLAKRSEELAPELIVADLKPVRTGICSAVVAIKHSSPDAKLILICPLSDLTKTGRRCGADACLASEDLFAQLPRTASALTRGRSSEKKTRTGVAS